MCSGRQNQRFGRQNLPVINVCSGELELCCYVTQVNKRRSFLQRGAHAFHAVAGRSSAVWLECTAAGQEAKDAEAGGSARKRQRRGSKGTPSKREAKAGEVEAICQLFSPVAFALQSRLCTSSQISFAQTNPW